MNEYLDSTGLEMYDSLIKSYIESTTGGLAGVRIITLNSAPTSSTLTYTLNEVTYEFKPGDEVRVVDNSSETGYTFYKLHSLTTEENVTTATWELLSTQTEITNILNKFDNNGKLPTSGISASTATNSVSGDITVSGATDVHFLTVTGNVSSVTVSPLPAAGKAITVIFTAESDKTIVIGHSASARVCPGGEDLEINVPAGGYAEVSFLSDGNKVFVRGI